MRRSLASEFTELVDSIGDPTLTVGLLHAAIYAKSEAGEVREALRLAQRVIDLAAGDPTMGNLIFGSPLAMATGMKGLAKMRLGIDGWQADADAAIAMAAPLDPTSHVATIMWKYISAIPIGALAADTTALTETAEALRIAEQTGDDFILGLAQLAHGLTLIQHGGPDRDEGLALLRQARESAAARTIRQGGDADRRPPDRQREGPQPEISTAPSTWHDQSSTTISKRARCCGCGWPPPFWSNHCSPGAPMVICGRRRPSSTDWRPHPLDPGFVLHELTVLRLRGLLARAHGDVACRRQFMADFRAKAAAAGFEPLVRRG